MSAPHAPSGRLSKLAVVACACLLAAGTRAATCAQGQAGPAGPDRPAVEIEKAKRLFWEKDTKLAVAALRNLSERYKDNPWVWHAYGIALRRDGDLEAACLAFGRALKNLAETSSARTELAYALLLAGRVDEALKEGRRALKGTEEVSDHYVLGLLHLGAEYPAAGSAEKALEEAEAAIRQDNNFAPAHLLRSRALVLLPPKSPPEDNHVERGRRLAEAAQSLEKFLTLAPSSEEAALWHEQLAALRAHLSFLAEPGDRKTVFAHRDVPTRAQILSRAEPLYTEQARRAGAVGSAMLRLVLAADGSVRHILIVRSLPHGLTAKAVEAARDISFKPATKDGRPVSQLITIQYNFNIY